MKPNKEELLLKFLIVMAALPFIFGIAGEIRKQQMLAEWRELPLSERGGYVNENGDYIPPSYLGRVKYSEHGSSH